jgi:S-adenosylmethionine synthetase
VVDAYQSFANVGGGCQNGKDATKVDFSASHMARKIACEYLKIHSLKWCEVQLSYAIGVAKPLAIYIDINIGDITPDFGDIRWQKNINVGYLDQHAEIDRSLTVFEYLKTAFDSLYEVERKLNSIYEKPLEK